MKRGRVFFALTLGAILLASCGGTPSADCSVASPGEVTDKYRITFDLNYEGAPEPTYVDYEEFDLVEEPKEKPTREGYSFTGWFEDQIAVTPFKWDRLIKSNWTVYAGWEAGSTPTSSVTPSTPASETPVESTSTPASSEAPANYVDYYIVGSFTTPTWGGSGTNFDKTYHLVEDGTQNKGKYLGISLHTGDAFKVVKFANGDAGVSGWHGGESGKSGTGWTVDTSDNNNIKITADGTYDVYLTNASTVFVAVHA